MSKSFPLLVNAIEEEVGEIVNFGGRHNYLLSFELPGSGLVKLILLVY
jgi:hypothetical protein